MLNKGVQTQDIRLGDQQRWYHLQPQSVEIRTNFSTKSILLRVQFRLISWVHFKVDTTVLPLLCQHVQRHLCVQIPPSPKHLQQSLFSFCMMWLQPPWYVHPTTKAMCQFCISWWGAKAAPGRVGGRETRQILLDKWWRWRSQIHPCPTCQCSTTKSTELPPLRHNSSSSQKLHHYFKRVKCNLSWQCTKLKLKLWELALSIC